MHFFFVLKEIHSKSIAHRKKRTSKSAFEILRPKSAFDQRRCQNRQVNTSQCSMIVVSPIWLNRHMLKNKHLKAIV